MEDDESCWVSLEQWQESLGYLPLLKLIANAPENRPKPKRKLIFQPSIFRFELSVSGTVVYISECVGFTYICVIKRMKNYPTYRM